ncbi:MAG TPA: hypothetical protein ENH84_00520 [Phycisphaerae bacterium]|nr:hypothetical protein [Phycisphaerae bacterium]
MLISQGLSELEGGHGRSPTDFAELRRRMADPPSMDDGHRQRLVDLARRLARIQALGDEYLRVDFSENAAAILMDGVAI